MANGKREVEAIRSEDNKVRKAKIAVVKDRAEKIYLRPIKELVLLVRAKLYPKNVIPYRNV